MAESTRASWWELYDLWPLARVEAFDRAVDAFEAGWLRGDDPSPDDFHDRATPDEWPLWLAELLAIEMLVRRSRGEILEPDEFFKRYPEDANTVRLAWSETFAEARPGPTRTLLQPDERANKHLLADGDILDGRYVIECFVRGGGMGELFRGRRIDDGRAFAFKAIDTRKQGPAESGDEPEGDRTAVARFLQEMGILADLRHPHLVSSIELLRLPHSPPVIVMDWVDGKDLQTLVHDDGPLKVGAACEITRQAADGLEYARRQYEVVHRDVKPANMMLTPRGEIKVLDFGLARARSRRAAGRDEELTNSNIRLGTIDFMAPEQWDDPRKVSSAADVYSLGVTLFFLLTGKTPFTIDKTSPPPLLLLRQAHAVLAPPDVRKWQPDVDVRLSRLIGRMLAKEPENRPTLSELMSELHVWCAGVELPRHVAQNVAAEESEEPEKVFWTRRRLVLAGGGFCVGGAAALATVFRSRLLPPPEVGDFHATLYKAATKETPEKVLGPIGSKIDDVPAGGLIQIDVKLSAPCYVQLIAANSDGSIRLLAASQDDGSAVEANLGRVRTVSFPRQGRWQLCDTEGLQAFVLVASQDPLPPFDTWRAKAPLEQFWSGMSGQAGVWRTHGDTIQALHPDDLVPRGSGHVEPNVPSTLQRFWQELLAVLPPRATAELIAFSLSY